MSGVLSPLVAVGAGLRAPVIVGMLESMHLMRRHIIFSRMGGGSEGC